MLKCVNNTQKQGAFSMNNVKKFTKIYENLNLENQSYILDILQTLKYSQEVLTIQHAELLDSEK